MEFVKLNFTERACWPRDIYHRLRTEVFITRTDTVLGISAPIRLLDSDRKINELKRRNSPLIVLISEWEHLLSLCEITPEQDTILRESWPGMITFILPKKERKGTVAVRFPSDPFLTDLICKLGPIWSTSANFHEEEIVQTIEEARIVFGHAISIYIDFDSPKLSNRPNPGPSTIVDLCQTPFEVVRQGATQFQLGTRPRIG